MPASPFALVRGAIDAATAASWLAMIDLHPAWADRAIDGSGDLDPWSSSLRLRAVRGIDAASVATALLHGEAAAFCRTRLGDRLALDLDRCWVRRQYAPSRYPPGHAPHSWHQDGALGIDFLADTPREGDHGLIDVVTCWIALTPCGVDAPGLELVLDQPAGVLPPQALADAAIRSAHPADTFLCPALAAGDALLFGGALLHRTHLTPTMRADRTSVEVRLFDAEHLPPRLRGDTFVALADAPLLSSRLP